MDDKKENNSKDKEKSRSCFIITPIGDDNSDTFRKAKGVIESVIKPTLAGFGYGDIKASYEINISGMINTQIINRIISDDLVVANLTDNNPNVMYELCLRHVVAKPIVHICENGTILPFDIKGNRTIFYKNDMLGVEELKVQICNFMNEIDYSKDNMDNPVYNAYKYGTLLKDYKDSRDSRELDIFELLLEIKDEIAADRNNSKIRKDVSIMSGNPIRVNSSGVVFDDLLNINVSKLYKYADAKPYRVYSDSKLRVHEMAKDLNITSQTIIDIANALGFDNIKCPQSGISIGEQRLIAIYIKDLLSLN